MATLNVGRAGVPMLASVVELMRGEEICCDILCLHDIDVPCGSSACFKASCDSFGLRPPRACTGLASFP